MMPGRILIVDRDADRRAALRAGLALPEGEVAELADPASLPGRLEGEPPELLLLDIEGTGVAGLEGLRRLRLRPGGPLAAIALVPPDRADLRLEALAAGADDATDRGVAVRLLQARVRSLLRLREEAVGLAPPEARSLGLAEAPAVFGLPGRALRAAAPRPRIAILAVRATGAAPPLNAVSTLLGAEVERIASTDAVTAEAAFDLVLIDGAGTRGDLDQGARVLALLADIQGRQRGHGPATLVMLPASAVETAALALDLGAGDVVVGPVSPAEVALRVRSLIARRSLREALRDQVRLGLRAAMTDPLTGLHNRRFAESELRRLAEAGGLAVLMIDIDHFKAINDTHGHAAGDRVLVEVGRRLRGAMRPGDLLARVGGEEFIVGLPGASPEDARLVAERLRRAVSDRPFALGGNQRGWRGRESGAPPEIAGLRPSQVRVTASIGVAAADRLDQGAALPALIGRADDALYEAKRAGRNSVAVSGSAAA